jgi:hypothetical protein
MMFRIARRPLLPPFLLTTAVLAGQTRPDFSGKWIDVQTVDGKEVVEETLAVTQDAQGLSYISYARNGREGERIAFLFNGTPMAQPRQLDGEATSTASWDGSTLVVVTTIKRRGEVQAVYQRRWLIDAAKQLVIETIRKSDGKTAGSAKTVYRRQQ